MYYVSYSINIIVNKSIHKFYKSKNKRNMHMDRKKCMLSDSYFFIFKYRFHRSIVIKPASHILCK